MGLIISVNCETCKGDGYLTVEKAAWDNFQVWMADPTENKVDSPDAFPEFLKRLNTRWGVSVGKIITVICMDCGGQKTISKEVSFEELKNLIK